MQAWHHVFNRLVLSRLVVYFFIMLQGWQSNVKWP